jgi:hypothetical protein
MGQLPLPDFFMPSFSIFGGKILGLKVFPYLCHPEIGQA